MVAVVRLVDAVNAGGVSRKVVGFDEDFKGITTILFLGNFVDARFKLREGIEVVKNSRTNEFGCFGMSSIRYDARLPTFAQLGKILSPLQGLIFFEQ